MKITTKDMYITLYISYFILFFTVIDMVVNTVMDKANTSSPKNCYGIMFL